MAMKFAFYQQEGGAGGPAAGGANWQTAANDPLADRSGIPEMVITWPRQPIDRSEPIRLTPLSRSLALPVALFEVAVMASLFVAAVATVIVGVGLGLEHPLSAEPAKPAARRVATVKTRILSLEPVVTPAAVTERQVD